MSMNKITHHPSDALLRSHVDGDLPESLAVGMTLHCNLCEHCKRKSELLTQEFAAKAWQAPAEAESVDFSQMLNGILNTEVETSYLKEPSVEHIFIDSFHYELPRVLTRYVDMKWNQMGAVSRARLIEEGATRSNLLHINAGGVIPTHTHKGFELTLLLDGSFEDESGHYHKGDFIWLDSSHAHSPKTIDGCLCYTVQNAPLHFTQGISKLFNPIGNLLY